MRNFYTSHVNIVVTFLREKGDKCHEIENRNWKIKYIGKNLIVNKVKINTCKHIVSLVKSFYFTKHIVKNVHTIMISTVKLIKHVLNAVEDLSVNQISIKFVSDLINDNIIQTLINKVII